MEKETLTLEKPKYTEAKIKLIITEDILLRTPFFGILVTLSMGGIAFFFVWFVLFILRPFMLTY